MRIRELGRAKHLFATILFVLVMSLATAGRAKAQGPEALPGSDARPAPPLPDPAVPPSRLSPDAVGESREAQLEERVRQLEAMVNRLATQVEAQAGAPAPAAGPAAASPAPAIDPKLNYPKATGSLAPGQGTPGVPAASDKDNMPYKAFNVPLKARFGPGFEVRSEDDEYVLQFHNLTQVDGRFYEQGGQQPVKDTFAIPRQWFMFSGRLTKPFEYFLSLQNGFDTVSLLDVFLNVHFDDRVQFKFGRYKTPFTYEFYQLPIQGLIQPERSLFFNNFGLNRQVGATVWGQLFGKKVDYAASILNTARNGFIDSNDGKAFTGYLNYRPFLDQEDSFFQYLSIGGSVLTDSNINPPIPFSLRTAIATTGNAAVGVPFLTYRTDARESGLRTFWDAHVALYRKQLSLVAEWQSGFQTYALANTIQARTRVPVDSFYVQAGYFLTGETVTGRNVVNPIKPFDLRPGSRGLGAVELTARYNYLNIGQEIFTAGLSDRAGSSNSLYTTDLGFNWSWSQNIRWTFDWEHAVFGDPVTFAPNRLQKTSDLFLIRMQIFF